MPGKGFTKYGEQGQPWCSEPSSSKFDRPHSSHPIPTLETFGGKMQVDGMGPVGHIPYLRCVYLCLALPYT